MENADSNLDASQQSQDNEDLKGNLSKLDQELASVRAQLESMNKAFAESIQSLATAVNPPKPEPVDDLSDEDIYDSRTLKAKIDSRINSIISKELQAEREKSAMIHNLAKEYPEITSDPAIQKAVLEAQKTLPKAMQDTPEGYEMAVLRAVAKAGLVPKSKRNDPAVEEDVSFGGSRGTRKPSSKKTKVSEKTLLIAQLLGRDINDPKVIKGLEEAASRETWTRFGG